MHFSKSKAVTQGVCSARQFFEPFAALGIEKIELFCAVREAAEAHAQQADFSFPVAMLGKQRVKDSEDIGIKPRRF